jgi:hypothetical protein
MKQIIESIREFFGLEDTVEKIEKPITSIVSKLGALEDKHVQRARLAREEAERRLKAAEAAEAAAIRAAKARSKYEVAFAE